MKQVFKRAVVGLLLGAIVVLGGGFASADYSDGDKSASASAEVTYTVASFRAIELTNTKIAFGTVRQGGTSTKAGPTVLYGTTWTGDKISVYLTAAMENGVKLWLVPSAPNSPASLAVGDTCSAAGVTVAPSVQVTSTESANPQAVITGITNCGYPQSSSTATPYPSGSPVLSEVNTSWASLATQLRIDTTGASDTATPGSLAVPQIKTLYFIIND